MTFFGYMREVRKSIASSGEEALAEFLAQNKGLKPRKIEEIRNQMSVLNIGIALVIELHGIKNASPEDLLELNPPRPPRKRTR